jgi:hypothetical protein
MAGLGLGPYGLRALGLGDDPPETLTPAKIGSSRLIDGKTRRYVLADDAGFEAMADNGQRVYLLTSLGAGAPPEFIDDRLEQAEKQRITEALAPLLDTKDPAIELQEVIVSDDGKDTSYEGVIYKDKQADTVTRKTPR